MYLRYITTQPLSLIRFSFTNLASHIKNPQITKTDFLEISMIFGQLLLLTGTPDDQSLRSDCRTMSREATGQISRRSNG